MMLVSILMLTSLQGLHGAPSFFSIHAAVWNSAVDIGDKFAIAVVVNTGGQ
jgi:hypothetical protein